MRPHRRGSILIVALVLLVLLAALLAAATRTGLLARRQRDLEERRSQALWLVESGLARAAARLAAEPDGPVGDWTIPASELDGRVEAVVTIVVEPVADDASQRRVTVRAALAPDSIDRRVVRSRTVQIPIGPGDVSDDAANPSNPETRTEAGPSAAPEEDP